MAIHKYLHIYSSNKIFRFPLTRYELVTSVDFKKCDSKAATCARLKCPKSKIAQLAALIGQDASEKVRTNHIISFCFILSKLQFDYCNLCNYIVIN